MKTKFVSTKEELLEFERICKEYYANTKAGKVKQLPYPSLNLPEIYSAVSEVFCREGINNIEFCKAVSLKIFKIAKQQRDDATAEAYEMLVSILHTVGYGNQNLVNQLFSICTAYSLDRLIHGCVRQYGKYLDYASAVNECYAHIFRGAMHTYEANRGNMSTYFYRTLENELLRSSRRETIDAHITDKKAIVLFKLLRFVRDNEIPVSEYDAAVRACLYDTKLSDTTVRGLVNGLRVLTDKNPMVYANTYGGEDEFDENLIADQIDSEGADERFDRAVLSVDENYEDLYIIRARMKGLSFYKIADDFAKIRRFFSILDEAGSCYENYNGIKEIKHACAIYDIKCARKHISKSNFKLFDDVLGAYNDPNYLVNLDKKAPAGSINYRYSQYMAPKAGQNDVTHRAFIKALKTEKLYRIADALKNSRS
jgi:DNA-directed RNA polymerase specialized sigma24 family protein